MCGRFDTSGLTWAQFHNQLSNWGKVRTAPRILKPDDFGSWMDPANDPAEVMANCRSHRFAAE